MWLLQKPQNYMRRVYAILVHAREKRTQVLTPLSNPAKKIQFPEFLWI